MAGSCPQGSCPQGSCPQGSCPQGSCPQGTVSCLSLCACRPSFPLPSVPFLALTCLVRSSRRVYSSRTRSRSPSPISKSMYDCVRHSGRCTEAVRRGTCHGSDCCRLHQLRTLTQLDAPTWVPHTTRRPALPCPSPSTAPRACPARAARWPARTAPGSGCPRPGHAPGPRSCRGGPGDSEREGEGGWVGRGLQAGQAAAGRPRLPSSPLPPLSGPLAPLVPDPGVHVRGPPLEVALIQLAHAGDRGQQREGRE
jgi:hypothetical protein